MRLLKGQSGRPSAPSCSRAIAGVTSPLGAAAVLVFWLSAGAAATPSPGAQPAVEADDPFAIAAIEDRLAADDLAGAIRLAGQVPARVSSTATRDPVDPARRLQALALRIYESGTLESIRAAEALFQGALALRERVPDQDRPGLGELLHHFSGLCFNRGDYDCAERLERRALSVLESALPAQHPQVIMSRRDLGFILMTEGRLAEGGSDLVASLRDLEAAGDADWSEVAITRNYVAELYRLQGRYEEAAGLLERLVKEATARLGEGDHQVHFFMNGLAGIYRDQERYDEAQTLLQRSLALRRAAPEPDTQAIARATLNLAELFRLQGRYADAGPLYAEALDLARRAWGAESGELFEFVNQRAVLDREQGRFKEAEPLALQARDLILRELGPAHPRVAQAEFDLGELLRASGRCRDAMSRYERAGAIREAALGKEHPEVAAVLVSRASCLAGAPDTRPAGSSARSARPDDRAAALAEVGRAVGILERTEAFPGVEVEALALRADLLRPDQPARARNDLGRALSILEDLRPHRGGSEGVRAGFLSRSLGLFERMVRWEVEDGRIDRALLYAERARARALLDQLLAARADGAEAGDAAARLQSARAEVAEWRQRVLFVSTRADQPQAARQRELRDLERHLEAANRTLRQAYEEARNASPAWRAATGVESSSPDAWIGTVVPADGLMLFYEIGETGSFLFVIPPPPHAAEVVPLAVEASEAARLGIAAGPLRKADLARVLLGAPGTPGVIAGLSSPPGTSSVRGIGALSGGGPSIEARLRALGRMLVPPAVWTRVAKRSEIIIVPDESLFLLPFEALVVGPEAQGNATRYWLDAGPPVRYAPSATSLREITRRFERDRSSSPRTLTLLSVSDPAYATPATGTTAKGDAAGIASGPGAVRLRAGGAPGPVPLPRLPGTAMETRSIRAALGGTAEITVLEGARAGEAEVRRQLTGKRYLHLATHGLVDQTGDDLFAALALTPSAGRVASGDDDGLLELREIYDLRLDCDLAVLSACRTNVGLSVAGEGIFALSRGFLVAGARRIIASQWSVDDASTAALVGELFRGLAAPDRAGPGSAYAAALRDAKRHVRSRAEWADPFFWAPFVLTGLP